MINAARTYLINKGVGSRYALGTFGEEYIPEKYVSADDDESMRIVRAALFGSSPDPFTQNYRAAQFMNVLHGSDLGLSYLLDLDKRYTYNPTASVYELNLSPIILPMDSQAQTGTITFSAFTGRDGEGLNAARYRISVIKTTNIDVTIEDQWWRHATTSFTVVGTSNNQGGYAVTPFTLPGTDTQVIINSKTNLATAASWIAELYARPSRSIDDILTRLTDIQGAVVSLCLGGKTEPYKTFYNMFLRHHRSIDRLAGALLALIYRTKDSLDAQ
jgi:hypothetical protein